MQIAVMTQGDKQNGMGHVKRQLVLANELIARGHAVDFYTQRGTPGSNAIGEAGQRIIEQASGGQYDVAIIDVENGPDASMVQQVRPMARKLVTIGSAWSYGYSPSSDTRIDLQIFQSCIPGEYHADAVRMGAEYIIIDPRYATLTPNRAGHIVVVMGGVYPHGMTQQVANALRPLEDVCMVVTGPAMEKTFIELSPNCGRIDAPTNLLSVLDGAALCICALGVTTYEALAAGVPCLVTNWSADHEKTAQALERLGCAYNLGLWDKFDGGECRMLCESIPLSKQAWESLSTKGRALVDGLGVKRVADALEEIAA